MARRRSIARRSARKPRSEASSIRCSSESAKSMLSTFPRGSRSWLARQSKPALSDDVLLDVGGTAADHEADVVHIVDVPCRSLIGLRGFVPGLIGEPCRPQHIARERGKPVAEHGAVVFDDETPEA